MEKISRREMVIWGVFLVVASSMVVLASVDGGQDGWEGRDAPALALRDAGSGEIVDLESLRGQVVVLNVYSTWCPPCKMEIPDLAKFHTANKATGRPVVLFGVVYESGEAAEALKVSQDLGVNYPVLMGTDPVFARYGLKSYPTTLVIDGHGHIIRRIEGLVDHAELEAWTAEALAHQAHGS